MTVKLGMFTMPFHHPARDYATLLALLAGKVMPRFSQHAAAGEV